jgi:hypothetical protein
METAFHFDPKHKQLSFLLKENVTSDPDIQLRFRGRLNTVTGGLEYHATAQKFVSTGTAVKVCLARCMLLPDCGQAPGAAVCRL